MATIGSLIVKVVADTGKFRSGMKGASSSLGKFRRGLGGLSTSLGGLGLALTGGGIIAGMSKMVDLARIQQQEEKKLGAVLAATGNAAGFSAQQLKEFASGLQEVTNFGDEANLAVMSILLTFKEIKGDQFKEATKAALDMSAVLGTSATAAALQLGKALNDPATGITALTRSGVSFTESQKDMIRSMQASGDMMGAQKLILSELSSEFGGAAEAMADPWLQFKNVLGDIGEVIGAQLIPYMNVFAEDAMAGLKDVNGEAAGLNSTFITLADTIDVMADSWKGLQAVMSTLGFLGVAAADAVVSGVEQLQDISPFGAVADLYGVDTVGDLKKQLDLMLEGMKLTVEEDAKAFGDAFTDMTPSERVARDLAAVEQAANGVGAAALDAADGLAAIGSQATNELLEAEAAAKKLADAVTNDNMINGLEKAVELAKATNAANMAGFVDPSARAKEVMDIQGMSDRDASLTDIYRAKQLQVDLRKSKQSGDDMDRGKAITEQFRTPLEEFNKTTEDLKNLFDIGAFDVQGGPPPEETLRRGLAKAQSDLDDSTSAADTPSDVFTPDIFTGRAEEGSAEAARIIAMAQAGGAAVEPQEKMAVDIKAIRGDFAALNASIDKGVEKLDPPETVETPP